MGNWVRPIGRSCPAGAPVGFSAAVPNDAALVSVQLYAQGLCGGAPGLTLSNALGLLIGN